jgi:hypothetical protein
MQEMKNKVKLIPDSVGVPPNIASMIKAQARANLEEMEEPKSWKCGENDESDTKYPPAR